MLQGMLEPVGGLNGVGDCTPWLSILSCIPEQRGCCPSLCTEPIGVRGGKRIKCNCAQAGRYGTAHEAIALPYIFEDGWSCRGWWFVCCAVLCCIMESSGLDRDRGRTVGERREQKIRVPHYDGRAPHSFAKECWSGTGSGPSLNYVKPAAAIIQSGRYAAG